MEDISKKNIIFLSYIDDDDEKVSGYFEKIEENLSYIKIKTKGNEITIPWHRIIKIKRKIKEEKDYE